MVTPSPWLDNVPTGAMLSVTVFNVDLADGNGPDERIAPRWQAVVARQRRPAKNPKQRTD